LLKAEIQPIKKWKKLKLMERGEPSGIWGRVLHAHLPGEISKREMMTASTLLGWPVDAFELR
jgi:RNA 3'-terminal phosphate cyclase (ATP)